MSMVAWGARACTLLAAAALSEAATGPPPADPVRLTINPGAHIWYAQPLDGQKRTFEVFYAYVLLDASLGGFGFHLEPRFRDRKLRDYFPGPVWLQEAFAYAVVNDDVRVKIGKLYSRLGLFWDGTFANLQYFDGVKLAPEVGVSAEGATAVTGRWRVIWALQYFVNDGTTNGSLPGRDTVSIPGARKADGLVARAQPEHTWPGGSKVAVGLSGQRFRAEFIQDPDSAVLRWSVDGALTLWFGLRLLLEYTRQHGNSVVAQPTAPTPLPAAADYASDSTEWALGMAEVTWGSWTPRAALSVARYADRSATETFLHPGLAYAVDPRLTLLTEWIYWRRRDPVESRTLSNGIHLIVRASY